MAPGEFEMIAGLLESKEPMTSGARLVLLAMYRTHKRHVLSEPQRSRFTDPHSGSSRSTEKSRRPFRIRFHHQIDASCDFDRDRPDSQIARDHGCLGHPQPTHDLLQICAAAQLAKGERVSRRKLPPCAPRQRLPRLFRTRCTEPPCPRLADGTYRRKSSAPRMLCSWRTSSQHLRSTAARCVSVETKSSDCFDDSLSFFRRRFSRIDQLEVVVLGFVSFALIASWLPRYQRALVEQLGQVVGHRVYSCTTRGFGRRARSACRSRGVRGN